MKGPTRYIEKGSLNLHLVFNGVSNRLKVFSRGGRMLFMVEARCDGARGSFDYAGGALPYGLYTIKNPRRVSSSGEGSSAFGPGIIELAGEEVMALPGRVEAGIHGGGLECPNSPPTVGGKVLPSLRLKKEDFEQVFSQVEMHWMLGKPGSCVLSVYK